MDFPGLFEHCRNIGQLAGMWMGHLERLMNAAGVESKVRAGADGAASLLAPAALIARIVAEAYPQPPAKTLKVLIFAHEPIGRMDEGRWASFAKDFLGPGYEMEMASIEGEAVQSSFYDVAAGLGLPPFKSVSFDEIDAESWDLVVWIHPVVESAAGEPFAKVAAKLFQRQVPVYACMYNEVDMLVQAIGMNQHEVDFFPIGPGTNDRKVSDHAVNRFGISSRGVGLDGGWGAVIAKLEPQVKTYSREQWLAVRAAMTLLRMDGAMLMPWLFGQKITGVAFGKYSPLALLGNMAVDTRTGLLFQQCEHTKVLSYVGHVWQSMMKAHPWEGIDLLIWASRVHLCFRDGLTREDKARAEAIAILEEALEGGVVEAAIALARGYEAVKNVESQQKALELYQALGEKHPLSAYVMAHRLYEQGDEPRATAMLEASADDGYPPAMVDFAKLHLEGQGRAIAIQRLAVAGELGSAEANFMLGEEYAVAGKVNEALAKMRLAWESGFEDAATAAEQICEAMLAQGVGKAGKLKRELKDIRFHKQKRTTYQAQLSKALD